MKTFMIVVMLIISTPAFAISGSDQFFQQKADSYLDWFKKYGIEIVAKQRGLSVDQINTQKVFCAAEQAWLVVPKDERDYVDKAARHEVTMTVARMQMITDTYLDSVDKDAINRKCGINSPDDVLN